LRSEKYLIWGYYGFNNLGDELMLEVIVRRIKAVHPEAKIYVRCRDIPRVEGIVPFDIERKGILSRAAYLLRLCGMIRLVDTFVIGGGTIFLDKGRHNASMLIMALAVFICAVFSKRVCVIGAGIDELTSPMNIKYLKYILSKSSFTALRDEFSFTYASGLVRSGSIVRSADTLYERGFYGTMAAPSAGEKKYILVSLSDHYKSWGLEEKRKIFIERSLDLVAELAKRWKDRYEVVLCAFQKGEGERDYELMRSLRERFLDNNRTYSAKLVVEYMQSKEEIRRYFSRAVFTIGMRYHALVLSSMFGVPFMGIDIEMKIRQISIEFGMPSVSPEVFLAQGIDMAALEKLRSLDIPGDKVSAHMSAAEENFLWIR